MLFFLLVMAMTVPVKAESGWQARRVAKVPRSRGAVMHGEELLVWGNGLWRVPLKGRPERLREEDYGAAGCLTDVNGDGRQDLVVQRGAELWWLAGPSFRDGGRIDTEAGMSNCLGMELLGKRGVLVMHRGLQLRHYRFPESGGNGLARWPYREVYSFYTASFQAGLLSADVDGDSIPDLIAGNYWIRSPEAYELPWRLFAINTYHEQPRSADMRMARIRLNGGGFGLVVAQAEMEPARIAVFTPPADVKQLWLERRLEAELRVSRAGGLAVADLDGDGAEDFVVSEQRGRIWWFRQQGGNFVAESIEKKRGGHTMFVVERSGQKEIVVVSGEAITRYARRPIQ